MWVGISEIIWVPEYFGETTKWPKLMNLRKTHALLRRANAVSPLHSKFITNFMTSRTLHSSRALLRLAHVVSPLHSTRGYGVATMSRLLKVHHELYDVTNSPLLSRFIAPSKCCKPSSLYERWGAGVETHFQEISWNLRPVVNGT